MVLLGPTTWLGQAYTPASMAATTMTMFDFSVDSVVSCNGVAGSTA